MPPRALLELAGALLSEVLRFGAPADAVVSAFFRRHKALGPRERHALAETAYAVLRRRLLFAVQAKGRGAPTERWLAMLAWQGPPAVLEAATTPAERAVLHSLAHTDPATLSDKLRHNLPDWVAQRLRDQLDAAHFEAVTSALLEPAPLDLRVNSFRARRDDVQAALAAAGVEAHPTPYSPWGLRVSGKPPVQRLGSFMNGEFEVQDEGSQLLALITGASRGEMVVDFCAGAGGKTLALGAMMRSTGRLYAFDTSAHRLQALKPRLQRSGLSNVFPAAISSERDERVKRLSGKVDRVLVDAPCSGLGTLRRNPDLKWRQSPDALAELAARQQSILTSAARLLRPGGRLVYATCSLLREENEAVAEAFSVAAGDTFAPVPAARLLEEARMESATELDQGGYLRIWPHLHATDGFFAATWQRRI